MVMRLLRTLEDLNWVVKESNISKYKLSLQPFYHASKVVKRMDLKVAAKDPIHQLWNATGETTYLVICHNERALIVDLLDSTRDVKISGVLGGSYFLHTTAPGKVMLAHNDELYQNIISKGLEKVTEKSITDATKLKQELTQAKKDGFAIDNLESNDGGLCFAVPIFNYDNKVVGSIGQTVVSLYYTMDEVIEKLGPQIIEAGMQISATLGYTGNQNKTKPKLTFTT
jgi:DNA-binding IclR family transcriptional regulator